MSKDETRPIVIKRIKKVAGGHHGGAWKIAYADFVTAMMAFFLLMWLLGSTAQGDLEGISDYFRTPLRVALQGGSGSGDSSSVIKGGGKDLTRSAGQVKNGDVPKEDKAINLTASRRELLRQEREHLLMLKDKIEKLIDGNVKLNQFRNQIRLDITKDGLRIQIVDDQNRPMFDIGSASLKDYTAEILFEIGTVLNTVDNKITLAGHTDATPYASGEKGYSNWELSSDRANASRRELIAAGMDEAKIVRVVGLASSVLFNPSDARDPANRRISIVVLNRQSAENIINDGQMSARDFEELEERLARVSAAKIGSVPGSLKP
jgi:chemotaxis protein MotB